MHALIGRARYCVTCKFSLILIFSQSFASWIVFLASNDEMRHRERGDVYCIDLVHTSPADFWFASIRTQNLINYYAKEHTWYKSVPITVPIESWHLLSRGNMAILPHPTTACVVKSKMSRMSGDFDAYAAQFDLPYSSFYRLILINYS